jgi:hypothetical protein
MQRKRLIASDLIVSQQSDSQRLSKYWQPTDPLNCTNNNTLKRILFGEQLKFGSYTFKFGNIKPETANRQHFSQFQKSIQPVNDRI